MSRTYERQTQLHTGGVYWCRTCENVHLLFRRELSAAVRVEREREREQRLRARAWHVVYHKESQEMRNRFYDRALLFSQTEGERHGAASIKILLAFHAMQNSILPSDRTIPTSLLCKFFFLLSRGASLTPAMVRICSRGNVRGTC